MSRPIIPIALLADEKLGLLSDALTGISPFGDTHDFDALLESIDEAERGLEGAEGKGQDLPRKAVTV